MHLSSDIFTKIKLSFVIYKMTPYCNYKPADRGKGRSHKLPLQVDTSKMEFQAFPDLYSDA